MPRSPFSTKFPACHVAVSCVALLATIGCTSPKGPMANGLAGRMSLTTASAEAVRAANVTPRSAPEYRDIRFHVCPKSGTVTHTPAYFRTDARCCGDNNTKFGISGNDYFAWVRETTGFFISIAMHPVDLLLTPPWTLMESDGKQARRAEPGDRKTDGSG